MLCRPGTSASRTASQNAINASAAAVRAARRAAARAARRAAARAANEAAARAVQRRVESAALVARQLMIKALPLRRRRFLKRPRTARLRRAAAAAAAAWRRAQGRRGSAAGADLDDCRIHCRTSRPNQSASLIAFSGLHMCRSERLL
jgi:hypothetical protein